MSDTHEHQYVPAIQVVDGAVRWERKLTATPLYPFACVNCHSIVWKTAQQALDASLILDLWAL